MPKGSRAMTKEIRLNAFDMNCIGHIQHGMWTHPRDRSTAYNTIEYWQDLARLAERGKFDGIFLADIVGVYVGLPDPYTFNALLTEAINQYPSATIQTSWDPDLEEIRGGKPRRSLLTSTAGAVQDAWYASDPLQQFLSAAADHTAVVPLDRRKVAQEGVDSWLEHAAAAESGEPDPGHLWQEETGSAAAEEIGRRVSKMRTHVG